MKQGRAWEANNSSTSLEFLRTLWNPTFYYHVHKSAIIVIKQSHFNPILTSHSVYKVYFDGIFPSTSVSSKWSLSVRFPHPSPSSSTLSHPTFGEDYGIRNSPLSSLFPLSYNSSLSWPNIFLSNLFWNYISVRFLLMWENKSWYKKQ